MKEPKITYVYQHEETGRISERTFTLSEIKSGEADAHIKLLPRYFLVAMIPVTDPPRPKLNREQVREFEALVKPLMRFLNDNCTPHDKIVITTTDAELLEGAHAIHTEEFIKD